MSLNEIMSARNVNNNIYVIDVHEWVGFDKIDIATATELRDKLQEVEEKIGHTEEVWRDG